jgi:hypothetical protein
VFYTQCQPNYVYTIGLGCHKPRNCKDTETGFLWGTMGLLVAAMVLLAWALLTPAPQYPTEYRQRVEISEEMQIISKNSERRRRIPIDPAKIHKH